MAMRRRFTSYQFFLICYSIFLTFSISSLGVCAPGDPLTGWKPNGVHYLADVAACEMGGGKENYMPADISPSTARDIPVYWNGKLVTWDDSMGENGEFVFDGKSGSEGRPDGYRYPMTNFLGGGLRCDHGSALNDGNSGHVCLPGRKLWNKTTNGITWMALFRRLSVARARVTEWNEYNPSWFDVTGIVGLKTSSYGVAWFNAKGTDLSGADLKAGLSPGPLPVPGGLNPQLRPDGVRASKFYQEPSTMEDCTKCHGTPFIGSDWIAQLTDISFKSDESKYFWNAAHDVVPQITDRYFFKYASKKGRNYKCGSCHAHWAVGAQTSPYGIIANNMTVAMAANSTSEWRSDASQPDYDSKNAMHTHMMPKNHTHATVREWESAWRQDYRYVACCYATSFTSECYDVQCPGDLTKPTEGPKKAVKPNFYSAATVFSAQQAHNPIITPPDPKQFVKEPQPPQNVLLDFTTCPTGIGNPGMGDKCWKLSYEDGTDPWEAARVFPMTIYTRSSSQKDLTDAEKNATRFCTATPALGEGPKSSQDILISGWRYRHEHVGVLPRCKKMWLRVCGSWCGMVFKGSAMMGASTEGTLKQLSNVPAGCPLPPP